MSFTKLTEILTKVNTIEQQIPEYLYGMVTGDDPLTVTLDGERGSVVSPSRMVEVHVGDRVILVRRGSFVSIMGHAGGEHVSETVWAIGQGVENNAQILFEQSELIADHKEIQDQIRDDVKDHGEHLADVVDPFIESTDTALAEIPAVKQSALDALAGASGALQAAGAAQAAADAAQGAAEAVQADLDNLQIGGRNWVYNSDFAQGQGTGGGFWTKYMHENAVFANGRVKLSNETGGGSDSIYQTVKPRIPDIDDTTPLTLSVWVRGQGTLSARWGAAGSNYLIPATPIDSETAWVRVTGTNNGPSNQNLILYLEGDGWLEFDQVKLERGNKATDWTPAPEDVDAGINAAQSTANTARSEATSKAADAEAAAKAHADAEAEAARLAAIAEASSDAASKAAAAEAAAKAAAALDAKAKADAAQAAAEAKAAAAQAAADAAADAVGLAQSQSELAYWKTRASVGRVLDENVSFSAAGGIGPYSAGSGVVRTLRRVPAPEGAPTSSGWVYRSETTAVSSDGRAGGFQPQGDAGQSAANRILLQTFVARLPAGTAIMAASNSVGSSPGAEGRPVTFSTFLTSRVADGTWQEFVRLIVCGTTGTFSTTGHIYTMVPDDAVVSEEEPFVWEILSHAMVDVTDTPRAFPGELLDGVAMADGKAVAAQAAASGALHVANLADDAAKKRVFFGPQPPPFEDWVEGQIWARTADYPHYETGGTTTVTVGLYVVQDWENPDSAWSTYTLMSGMIIVPGVDEDGNPRPTVIDGSGMVVGHVTADSITGDVIAARSLRGEHLVIASVTPDLLDEATQETLEGADAVRRRVVIEDTGIIISESAVGEGGTQSLSGLDLRAKRLSFFLGGEPRAYIDSEKNMMGMEHLVVERSAQFGEHQVLSLGGDPGQTIFRWTGLGG